MREQAEKPDKPIVKSLFTDAMESLGLPYITADRTYTVTGISSSAQALLGGNPVGVHMADLLGLSARALSEVESSPVRLQVRLAEIECESVTVIPLPEDGGCLAVLSFTGNGMVRADAESGMVVLKSYARLLARSSSYDGIIRETVEFLPEAMSADAAWIHVAGSDGTLSLLASKGCTEACIAEITDLNSGQCVIGKVFESGRPALVREASTDARVTHISTVETGLRSMAVVPVFSHDRVLGVLSVASSKSGRFAPHEMMTLSMLSKQLGYAMDNARLISELHSRMDHIRLTGELIGSISTSLSIGSLFKVMASEIGRIVSYDRASLLLYDAKRDDLTIFALETRMKTTLPRGRRSPIDGTSAGWALRSGIPVIMRNLKVEMPFPLDRRLLDDGICSTISIPLVQDKTLAVFNLDSTLPERYSEKDLALLLPVSRHIALALDNALLFEEVSRERREWEKTFDAITDMVWIEDLNRKVLRANRMLLQRTALGVAEVTGMSCMELLSCIGIRSSDCLCEVEQSMSPSFRELREQGGSIYHLWAYPLIDDDGRLYGVVHYMKDVTEKMRIEQDLVRSDKLASLGILGAGIAHEINNPLGIIAGYAEALIDRARSTELRGMAEFEDFPEYLETIHKEIFRCKEILGSLLEFARPYGGKARALDINEIIKEVILLVKHRARRLNHRLELNLEREIPKVFAEPGNLRQLFMNIIINAMYFTPEGGSIVIKSWVERSGDSGRAFEVRVSIRDTGGGIPDNVMPRIFDPFFTTKPIGEGTGLGLSICHKIAREYGGAIYVESENGAGATFTIVLPARA